MIKSFENRNTGSLTDYSKLDSAMKNIDKGRVVSFNTMATNVTNLKYIYTEIYVFQFDGSSILGYPKKVSITLRNSSGTNLYFYYKIVDLNNYLNEILSETSTDYIYKNSKGSHSSTDFNLNNISSSESYWSIQIKNNSNTNQSFSFLSCQFLF